MSERCNVVRPLYTDFTIGDANSSVLENSRDTLDANGLATAWFNVPANLPPASGFTFHHVYVVYDASRVGDHHRRGPRTRQSAR